MRSNDFVDRVQINTRDFEALRDKGIELYNLGSKAGPALQGTAIRVCDSKLTITDYYDLLHQYVQDLEEISKRITMIHDKLYDKLPMDYKQATLL